MASKVGSGERGFLRQFLVSLQSRHTLRSHVWQSLANYTQQGFGLIFGVVLARLLTPADFGAYGLALATVLLALLPGMWSLAPALLADSGRTPRLHHVAASFGWSIAGIRLAIVGLVVTWFWATGRHPLAWLCLIVGLTESFRELNNVQKGFLEGAGKFEPNFISVLTNMIFCIAVVIPLTFLHWGPFLLTLPPLGMVITDFFIYRYFAGRSVLVKPSWSIPTEFFHSGFWLWLSVVSEVGLARFDKWFVGRFRGDAALGHYSRAFGYAPLAFLALNSFATNPTISGLARCETPEARLRLFLKTSAILIGGGLLNWIIFFFFSRQIVLLAFGRQWEGTIPIFHAFASLSLAYAIAYLPITAMYSQKRFREVAVVRVAILMGFLAFLLIFREILSPVFVAWLLQAVLVAQGIVLLLMSHSIFRRSSIPQPNV